MELLEIEKQLLQRDKIPILSGVLSREGKLMSFLSW